MSALTILGLALSIVTVEPGDSRALEHALLEIAESRLQPAGLFVDRQRAWLTLSGPLPSVAQFEARPLWTAEAGSTPALPLTFELRPICAKHDSSCPQRVRATLAVSLQKDVWVAARRLRRGSRVACADLDLQRRPMDDLPKPLLASCEVAPGSVALRDLSAGAALRAADIGNAPAVLAGMPVDVSAVANGVSITTRATALADAQVGDRLDVRLQSPRRTLRTRVIAPGVARVIGGSL